MKKQNEGKKFEKDFKASVPSDVYCYRYKDGTASWGSSCPIDIEKFNEFLRPSHIPEVTENLLKTLGIIKPPKTRFQAKNICDFELLSHPNMFLIELKSLKGKSYPFAKWKEKSKLNQIKELTKASKHNGLFCGLLINFRDVAESYYISIEQYNTFEKELTSKSIPLSVFREDCIKVDQEIKKVNYKYNISKMLNNIVHFNQI